MGTGATLEAAETAGLPAGAVVGLGAVVLGLGAALLVVVAGFLLRAVAAFAAATGFVPLLTETTAGLAVPTGFRSATFAWVLEAAVAAAGAFLAWAAAPMEVGFFTAAAVGAFAGFLVAPLVAGLETPLATRV